MSLLRSRRLRLLSFACCALALIAAACGRSGSHTTRAQRPTTAHPSVTYGVSFDYLNFWADQPARLFAKRVLGPAGHVRLWLPYDSVGYWNGSECAASPESQLPGSPDWTLVSAQLQLAHKLGLKVEIEIAPGSGQGGVPRQPDPAIPAQANDYRCGISMALASIRSFARAQHLPQVRQFEAWNEPNLSRYGASQSDPCPTPASGAGPCSGPWQAAMLWYIAQTKANELHREYGYPKMTFAALTMSAPQLLPFLDDNTASLNTSSGTVADGYYQQLYAIVHCQHGYGGCTDPQDNPKRIPPVWAVHDYADPTAGGTKDLQLFATTLAELNDKHADGAGAHVWVTEAGVDLQANFQTDENMPGGVRCSPGNTDTLADSLGCMADGNEAAQAAGARVWLKLPSVAASTSNGGVSIRQLYWYQFQLGAMSCSEAQPCQLSAHDRTTLPVAQLHAWDSALVDASGRPRTSFCVLTGEPVSSCDGSATDYANAHWIPWWEADEMPLPCPDPHDGAWVANRPGSGVPGGEECYYDTDPGPTELNAARSG